MSNKKNNRPLPASSAGLLRFFEDETEGIKIRPEFVLVACIGLIATSIGLNILFRSSAATTTGDIRVLALNLLSR